MASNTEIATSFINRLTIFDEKNPQSKIVPVFLHVCLPPFPFHTLYLRTATTCIKKIYMLESCRNVYLTGRLSLNPIQKSAKFVSKEGEAGEAIVAVAEKEKANLIVTGTRGMGKLRRTFLGSVSDYVIHHAKCPVLVCRK